MVDSTVTVLPADALFLPKPSTVLGPGTAVNKEGDGAYLCKAGTLQRKGEDSVWVHCQQKRYVPSEGERVLGVVIRTGRVHKIDIGSSQLAALQELAFEGATKRNKPSLQVGDLIFARISQAHRGCEPELTCVDSSGRGNGMGLLRENGCVVNCTLSLCRKLLTKSCPVLQALQQHFKFEITIGLNGRVLVCAPSLMQTIVVRNCLIASEYMEEQAIKKMVEKAVMM